MAVAESTGVLLVYHSHSGEILGQVIQVYLIGISQ